MAGANKNYVSEIFQSKGYIVGLRKWKKESDDMEKVRAEPQLVSGQVLNVDPIPGGDALILGCFHNLC